jgi:hypothetical protein
MQTETNPTEGTGGTPPANGEGAGSGQAGAEGASAAEGGGAAGSAAPEGGAAGASGEGGGAAAGEGAGAGGEAAAGEGSGTPGEGEGGEPPALEFTVPEGIEVSDDWRKEVNAFAVAEMTPAQRAQGLVDLGVKFQQQVGQALESAHRDRVEQWAVQAKSDPVVGGKDYDANVAVALSAVGQFGDAELKQVFEDYGLGNNPAMIRAFYKIGKAMGEAGGVHGVGQESQPSPANTEAAQAERMYAAAGKPKGNPPRT